jgi:hypothetical protein
MDGQHRLLAAKEMDFANVPALVHVGLTPQQEADLFRRLQDDRKALSHGERFKARLYAKEPIAVGMSKTAKKFGLEIATGPKSLQAVVAVERCYRRGNLEEALDIMQIWAGDSKTLEGPLVEGVSRFLDLFAEADRDRCREQWVNVSPTVVIRRASEFMKTAHSQKSSGVLEVLRDLYTSKKFPLLTVEKAMAERKAVESEQGRRYRRVSAAEVRDAMMELCEAAPSGQITVKEIREKAGASHASLTKRGGLLDQLLDQGTFKRVRDGSYGPWHYEYVPPHKQSAQIAARRSSGDDQTGRRRNGSDPVPYTGRPEIRSGSKPMAQRRKAERGKRIVQKK